MNRSSTDATQAHCTLLQLVSYLSSLGASEQQTIDTVLELLRSGRVRLIGNFRGRPFWCAAQPGLRR